MFLDQLLAVECCGKGSLLLSNATVEEGKIQCQFCCHLCDKQCLLQNYVIF